MSIQLSDLMPGAGNCIQNVARIRAGESVLIVTDTTADRDVVEAYKIAAEMAGARASVLTLPSTFAGASPDEITSKGLYGFFPPVAFAAMTAVDVCIIATAYTDIHGVFGTGADYYAREYGVVTPLDIFGKFGTRMLSVVITNKEALASPWARYPEGLLRLIERMAHTQLYEACSTGVENARVRITDPQGTDLSFAGFRVVTKWSEEHADVLPPFAAFGTAVVGVQPADPEPNAEGVIVSTSIHTGYVPEMKMTIRGGRAVAVEGGGSLARVWAADFEKGKDASSLGRHSVFGELKYPGVNWIEEFMYGLHPKAFRMGHKYRYEGSDAFGAWNGGTRRSGVAHFGIGGGKNDAYRHRDLEIFAPTISINDKVVVQDGRLTLLDDPRLREEAAKYGDPDHLLTEDWVPDVPPND